MAGELCVEPGNHAGAVTFPVAATTAYRRSDGLPSASSFFLSRVEVEAPQAAGLLVAFGEFNHRRNAVRDRSESALAGSPCRSPGGGRNPNERRQRRDWRRTRA